MLIDSQRVEASKLKGRYVGDNWKSGLEILVEMMEEDFSLFDETFCNTRIILFEVIIILLFKKRKKNCWAIGIFFLLVIAAC